MSPNKETLDELRIDRGTAPRRKPPYTFVMTALTVIAVAAGLVGWLNWPKAVAVRTAVVLETEPGREKTLLNASGYVSARREATVSSKVTGRVES